MLFGDKNDFAIECYIDRHDCSGVWGRQCVWSSGTALGDVSESSCSLFHAYTSFRAIEKNLDGLWDERFEQMSDEELWNYLDERLYGYHGDVEVEDTRTEDEVEQDANRYHRFDFLTNWGEQFDAAGKCFLFCPPGPYLKILHWDNTSRQVTTFRCSKESFIPTVHAFLVWYARQ